MNKIINIVFAIVFILSLTSQVHAFSCSNCGSNGGGGGAPTGPAGGALGGTYPNPSLAPLSNNTFLQGRSTDGTIHSLLGIDLSNNVHISTQSLGLLGSLGIVLDSDVNLSADSSGGNYIGLDTTQESSPFNAGYFEIYPGVTGNELDFAVSSASGSSTLGEECDSLDFPSLTNHHPGYCFVSGTTALGFIIPNGRLGIATIDNVAGSGPPNFDFGLNVNGNAITSAAFGSTLNLSTLMSGGATITNAGVITINSVASGATGATATAGDSSTKIATTAFVANIAAGINPAVATQEATTTVLPNSPAYLNGVSGVGATLIATGNAALVVDGITVAVGDRVLVKNQASTFQNGIYDVTATGSGIALYTLTRDPDFDQPSDINSTGAIPVITGTVNAGTSWVLNVNVPAVGSPNAITFTQFSYALANQASLSGNNAFTGTNTFLTNPIAPLSGGLGAALTLSIGDILYATSSTVVGRLADVATGSVLCAGGVTTAPSYCNAPALAVTNFTGTLPALNGSAVTNLNAANVATGQLAPARGGVGAFTSAPAWARWFGDGNEGAKTTGAESLSGLHEYTTFSCNTTISPTGGFLAIYATTSITLNASCLFNFGNGATGAAGAMGGQGGSGGGGTAAGAVGLAMAPFGNISNNQYLVAPATSGSSGGAGTNGAAEPANIQQLFILSGPLQGTTQISSCGGGSGSTGGSSGGTRGGVGRCIFLVAPTITIANGTLIDVSGGPGISAAANTQGGGGGGGGGVLMVATESLTDNSSGTYFKIGGGAPGMCSGPAIQLANAPGDSTGFGGQVAVTGLTSGGIDATKVTVTGGSGYTIAPTCTVLANGSGITGSPTCTTTISGGAVTGIVVGTAGSGGTLSSFTTCGIGGSGQPGLFKSLTIQ